MPVCQVAVPSPLRRLLDYLVPPDVSLPPAGARVRVPFGRRALVVGVVVAHSEQSELAPERLKPLREVIDQEPLLPADILALLLWAARYYHYPVGEVVCGALPTRLRQGAAAVLAHETRYRLTPAGAVAIDRLRAPLQRRLLETLKTAAEGLGAADLAALASRWQPALRALLAKEWVSAHLVETAAPVSAPAPAVLPELNSDQAAAAGAIGAADGFRPFLLRGITGSGKTEVYMRAIERVLARGRSALVLVPEIGLTPQLIDRFRRRFAVPLAILHSGLSDTERAQAWLLARAGKAPLVLGTRSAAATPMPGLGLIIIDEEHDTSYKQQDGFRYSARDLAVMRARRADIPIVLGSATPSLETLNQAKVGTYIELGLPHRAGGAALPRIELLDLRKLPLEDGLSHPLRQAITESLAGGEQSLLFINRRGFAPVLLCADCGFVAPCPRCDARLTLHRSIHQLICHHCGTQAPVPRACPACAGARLQPLGQGTERVEGALSRYFPAARVVRLDRDSTRRKGSLESTLQRMHAGEADILVGTQMLSKGHDFPNVTLVGVINADQGLYSADFRGPERLFQQMTQVAGRAGRASRPGRVLIQTYHPDHELYAALRRHDYTGFADFALRERHQAALPPFRHLALLRAEATDAHAPLSFLRQAQTTARGLVADTPVEIFDPTVAPMERRAGRYRAQLLVQAIERRPLHALLDAWLPRLADLKAARRVRWSIDVDPLEMF